MIFRYYEHRFIIKDFENSVLMMFSAPRIDKTAFGAAWGLVSGLLESLHWPPKQALKQAPKQTPQAAPKAAPKVAPKVVPKAAPKAVYQCAAPKTSINTLFPQFLVMNRCL